MMRRLCIIGVGLIGGSAALAARDRQLCGEIVGIDPDAGNLSRALELGVIDRGSTAPNEWVRDADFVLLAVPVGSLRSVLDTLKPLWSDGTVYTDAGSTKMSVVDNLRQCYGEVPANFVPGHPIAGAEQSGVEAAQSELYFGKRVILTPGPGCDPGCLRAVTSFWSAIGANVALMEPDHHDAVLAATSHLPHVLAFTLAHLLGAKDAQQEIFQYASGGFRDFTRIASSDPTMWLDICLANRSHILPLIEEFCAELGAFAHSLQAGSSEEVFDFLASAREARQRFLARLEG
jgi:prephenate dehydrogenase